MIPGFVLLASMPACTPWNVADGNVVVGDLDKIQEKGVCCVVCVYHIFTLLFFCWLFFLPS